jgi:hypothetical protein
VEEVPLDQLVEFEDDGFPDPDQLVGPGEEGFPIEQMEVEDAHVEEEEQQVFHQNLNIGLVLHNHWDVDPALLDWEKGKTVEATRLWANFFSRGNADCLHVKIPSAWSNFFTVTLLSPNQFTWVREFLSSKAPALLDTNQGFVDYFIPTTCPSDKNLECACTEDDNLEENKAMLVELEEDDIQIAQSTSKKMKKGKRPLAVVDSNLRRSPRIKTGQ